MIPLYVIGYFLLIGFFVVEKLLCKGSKDLNKTSLIPHFFKRNNLNSNDLPFIILTSLPHFPTLYP